MILIEPLLEMTSPHMDFIGQRADKEILVDVDDVDAAEESHTVVKNGILREVKEYTISCDECDGDGYYDDIGEVICDGCGMVLSGDTPPVIQTEFSENDGAVARGRGVEKMNTTQFGHEPSI